jgi:hypothetical protein
MNKTLKIILTVFGLLIIGLGGLVMFGMYSIEIEDTYGDNQDIFYNSKQGDIVVNNYSKELGQIAKTWTKLYVINKNDTLNINEWWDDKNIEILRPVDKDISVDNLSFADIDGLKKEKRLELIKRLR